jgi:hypothetical protein
LYNYNIIKTISFEWDEKKNHQYSEALNLI